MASKLYSLLFTTILSLFFIHNVSAHHSRSAFYDTTQLIQLEGEITRVLWRHPHVRYWMQADQASGGGLWELETTPPSILEREGINKELVAVGTRVRVAGPPARFTANAMEVSHVLLPDGREVHLYANLDTLWSEQTVERSLQAFDPAAVVAAQASAKGIFRVWSREGGVNNQPRFWLNEYPLTDSAVTAAAAWDVLVDTDTGCNAKGFPNIMSNIWPFEFVDEGEQIRLKIEEFDQQRIVYLVNSSAQHAPSPMGYSLGHWEGSDLVVTTRDFSPAYFGAAGIELGSSAEIVERFILSADANRLDYQMTVTDPATLTGPVTQSSYWIWRPGEILKPYDCVEVPESWTTSKNK